MNPTNPESEICEVVSAVLGKTVDLTASRANEPLWDSLKHMEIIFAVESKWGVVFSEEEMGGIQSLVQLLQMLKNKNAA